MTVIDARALHLLPGFIDVHTHLGLYDEGTGWAGNDANETSEVSTPHIRSLDGIHPLILHFKMRYKMESQLFTLCQEVKTLSVVLLV